jgi:hypothetical protein
VRTTIALEDRLLARAKKRAAQAGLSFSDFVARAVRRELDQPRQAAAPRPFRLVTFKGQGLAPGFAWSELEHQTLDRGPG